MMSRKSCEVSGIRDIHGIRDVLDLRSAELLADDEGNESSRPLGLIVARGTLLVLISPVDGSEEIANPFMQAEDE